MNHEPWCVRRGEHTGSCSEKRGHWDRSTNTWDSDLTPENREMIAEALKRWRENGEPREQVVSWVRTHPGFERVVGDTLNGWWMVHRSNAARGRSWPILSN